MRTTVTFLPAVFLAISVSAGIVDRASELEKIPGDFELADGPTWNGSALFIPDVKGQNLYRYTPRGKKLELFLKDAGRLSASFFNHGRLYVSDNGNSQISFLQGKQLVRIAGQDPNAKPPARPNDLVVDNQGGIYYTLTRQNQVIYIAPDGAQSVAVNDIAFANGITLSPDNRTLYVAAYKAKQIWSYHIVRPGRTAHRRLFATMNDGAALGADGMCMDRAGNVYCAGATDIWIWSPQGALLDLIATPERPINCAFGDNDLRSLYITGFGGLYRQRMNAYGVSSHPGPVVNRPGARFQRPQTTAPANVTAHLDVVYAQDGDRKLLADIFVPKDGEGPLPAIVVVHGGGWLNGDKTKFRALAVKLASLGYVTAAIQYRLGHEARFPAGAQDCFASVRFLRDHARKYRLDPKRIGAVGGSAGGHLVGLLATGWDEPELKGAFDRSSASARVSAAIVMAGPMEILTGSVAERSREPNARKPSNAYVWIGDTIGKATDRYRLADAHVKISPDDPPLLFMVGEHDHPDRNQPSREALKRAGVPTGVKIYADGKHGCWNVLPWFNDMVADMDEYFGKWLRK